MSKIEREVLIEELESVIPGLSERELIEQSSCFVFSEGMVHTYNDEIACSIPCSLPITGAVRAKPLLALLHLLKDDHLEVDVAEGKLLISHGRRRASLAIEETINLPINSIKPPKDWQKVPGKMLDALEKVQICAGKDETQFITTCIHLDINYVECFNNYQAARFTIKTGLEKSILIRYTSISHIIKLGFSKMGMTKQWLHFKNKRGLLLSTRLYIEQYRELDQLFGREGTKISLPRKLTSAIACAEIFSSQEIDSNLVRVTIKDRRIQIQGKGPTGEYTESKEIQFDGEREFHIDPEVLSSLIENHSDCFIGDRSVIVKDGPFQYIAALTLSKKTKNKEKRTK